MFINSFYQMLPIFIISLGGYLTNRLFDLKPEALVKLVADFFTPMLIFQAIYRSDLHGSTMVDIALSVTFVVVCQTLIAYLYTKITKIEGRDFIGPATYMNSGFLGMPLMKLWGGVTALNLIIIYDQILTMYMMTLGLMIIAGGLTSKSFGYILKSPILWAITAGFIFKFLEIPVPQPILTTFEFGGDAVFPLAAYILGVSLSHGKIEINRHVIAGITIRVVGGLFLGLLAVTILKITGLERTVIVVASTLPSAVLTSVLPIRYNVPTKYSGPIVMLSTLISVFTIPISFMLIG